MSAPYLIAGNWKMHKSITDARAFLKHFLPQLKELPASVQLALCPQNAALSEMVQAWGNIGKDVSERLAFGTQNTHWAESGAFTGELAPQLAKELGATYAIIGHSERRQFFGESNETAADRAKAALAADLTPIFCVGENLSARESDNTEAVLRAQLGALFATVAETPERFVIAYEPVWAIGTGKTATAEQAESAHAFIREFCSEHWNADFCAKLQILYGGSVKPANAKELLSCPNVNGALVGGASLEPDQFAAIAAAAN